MRNFILTSKHLPESKLVILADSFADGVRKILGISCDWQDGNLISKFIVKKNYEVVFETNNMPEAIKFFNECSAEPMKQMTFYHEKS